jgi:tetratricopeptide (TPR) repeat protein
LNFLGCTERPVARTVLTVFLSSTGADLDAYRAEIRKQIGAVDFLKCIAMEDFGPRDANAIDHCQKEVVGADLFVGVIGLRRGWEPDGDNQKRSITEMEYDWATGSGRSRFMCIAPDDFPIKGNLRDNDEQHGRQVLFRKRVSAERIAGMRNFETPQALAAEVVSALLSHIISSDLIQHLRPELAGPEAAQAQAPLAAAVETLAADDDIDLLALARNPRGVEVAELESKLRARADKHEQRGDDERRISAEYWRHLGALAFLHDLKKAEDAYRRSTILDPDNLDGRYWHGRTLFRMGNLKGARRSSEELRRRAATSGDTIREAAATGDLAEICQVTGDLDQAEDLALRSLALWKKIDSRDGEASEYTGLGLIYSDRGDLDKAEKMHRKSLKLYEELSDDVGIATQLGNLGNISGRRTRR